MKDQIGGKTMTTSWEKTCSCLTVDGSKDKKAKGTKRCVIKRKLKFKNYKNCLGATHLRII